MEIPIKPRGGLWAMAIILLAAVGGGCCDNAATPKDSIAVSSPYLEAAIRDVLTRDVALVRLAGPSMCPGHFDLQPSKIVELSRCRLLVRFDFQKALDKKVADRTQKPSETETEILSVELPGGLCEPETYLSACRQVADHLVSMGEMKKPEADRRLDEITQRLSVLADDVHRKIDAAALRDAPVLTSGHQAAFCRWMGLRTAGAFTAGDTAGSGEIDDAVKAGEADHVKIIVANEPEGRRLADALADRFGARVVVFANFPEPDEKPAFDNLVRRNLATLLDGKKP
jgi:zinc transport system substrate-binding protein